MNDSLEEQLFTIKSKFLREIPHPKLILKAINELRQLSIDKLPEFVPATVVNNHEPLAAYLPVSIEKVLQLKLAISQANEPVELFANLGSLYNVQWSLLAKLSTYLPLQDTYPDGHIKMSDPIDSYEIWRFLSGLAIPENEIKPYICKVISGGAVDVLTTACLRSRKIISNAGSV